MKFYSEFLKCRDDLGYFVENYCQPSPSNSSDDAFELYPCQKGALYNIQTHRFFLLNACRQSGKTMLLGGAALWEALFKADKKIVIISSNTHSSNLLQKRIVGLAPPESIKSKNIRKLEFHTGSTIGFLSSTGLSYSLCGYNPNIIFLDDFAYFENQNLVMETLFPIISSRTHTKLVMMSTKNSEDDIFYSLYKESKKASSDWVSQAINWWDIPTFGKKMER